MTNQVKPIPDGFRGATPYLCVKGAAEAIDFYRRAFGAVELMRMGAPGDRVGHAEIKINDALIMISDEFPEMKFVSPQTLGGTPVMLYLYFEDVDAVAERAVAAGAKLIKPVADQFYGDRSGRLEDPFGHSWYIATHIEDVSPGEAVRRAAALFG